MTGKILKGIAGFYYVHGGDETIYECKAKGIFRNKNVKPLVGDNVEFSVLDSVEKKGNIERILPRKNALVRPAVANVDQALVLFAITHPEPNLNLLDRFLVMMEVQELPVKICFNKIDLTDNEKRLALRDIYEAAGYPVYFTSTYDNQGIQEIKELVHGRTTVLAGPSGVGKSSLTNLLYPQADMETATISEKIQRGKHTTRHSEIFGMGGDTYLMDTPGFSSMYMEDMECNRLKDYFPEFEPYEDGCRFLGCVHIGEKTCGVKDAVKEGKINRSRYENYRLLYQELKEKRRY
ncbi:ribosome small subunit-dependent GTPase A [Lacrimispora indolis]|uniref:ribosome small subunit-dependent GTPase A n=1 Tax=Lacrimispora indolis TaxID=69825 RepID=UPI0004288DD0|nr:ribosome small subunit-dependent GTPase A [[Clostridium] methoxybenzovorans]